MGRSTGHRGQRLMASSLSLVPSPFPAPWAPHQGIEADNYTNCLFQGLVSRQSTQVWWMVSDSDSQNRPSHGQQSTLWFLLDLTGPYTPTPTWQLSTHSLPLVHFAAPLTPDHLSPPPSGWTMATDWSINVLAGGAWHDCQALDSADQDIILCNRHLY